MNISKRSVWAIDARWFRKRDCILISLGRLRITLGSPFLPFLNRIIDWWKQLKLYNIWRYYKYSKEIIDIDIYYRSVCGDMMQPEDEIEATNWYDESTETSAKIIANRQGIPRWIVRLVDKSVDRYYERRINH